MTGVVSEEKTNKTRRDGPCGKERGVDVRTVTNPRTSKGDVGTSIRSKRGAGRESRVS